MGKLSTITIVATTLYLALITLLALTTSNNASHYIDDVSMTLDGKTLRSQNFTMEDTNPAEYIGEARITRYSQEDYSSPPGSLAILRKGGHGVILEINVVVENWSELKISFMTKITGEPPSNINLDMIIDDGYLGSHASIQLGERDLLSGRCHWHAYDWWDASTPRAHYNFAEEGDIEWDWSSWHRVDLTFDLSASTFTFCVDSNDVSILEFGSFYGSDLKVMWQK